MIPSGPNVTTVSGRTRSMHAARRATACGSSTSAATTSAPPPRHSPFTAAITGFHRSKRVVMPAKPSGANGVKCPESNAVNAMAQKNPEEYLAKDFATLMETMAQASGMKLTSENKNVPTGLEN